MRVIDLVMKRGIPAKLRRRNLHGFRKIRLFGAQQRPPACGIIVAKPRGILATQRVNNRPDVALMRFQLAQRLFQINSIFGSKQAVFAMFFRTRSRSNVAHIDAVCVFVQKLHAVARGDVIHVTSGTFGIQEACFLNQL